MNYLKSPSFISRKEFLVKQFVHIQFIFVSVLSIFVVFSKISGQNFGWSIERLGHILVIYLIFICLIRFFLLKRLSYKLTLSLIIAFTHILITTMVLNSTSNLTITHMQIAISTLALSIIISVKHALIYVVFASLTFVLVAIHHEFNGVVYTSTSYILDSLSLVGSTFLIWVISKLGYDEVNYSYKEASYKSDALENLRNELSKRIKQIKFKIEQKYIGQIDNLHKMAVIGSITRSIFHDIKTPLSSIEGAAHILERSNTEEPELVKLIKESTDQIKRIIRDAQDLYKGKTVKKERFKVVYLVNKVFRIVNNYLITYNIKIQIIESSPNIEISGLRSLFERILMNLIVNAIEELKENDKDRQICVTISQKGNYAFISVRDNGRGIEDENIYKIFDSHFSSKSAEHNMGIGLPYVKHTLKKEFNGEISVKSKKNEYTEFTIKIPLN